MNSGKTGDCIKMADLLCPFGCNGITLESKIDLIVYLVTFHYDNLQDKLQNLACISNR